MERGKNFLHFVPMQNQIQLKQDSCWVFLFVPINRSNCWGKIDSGDVIIFLEIQAIKAPEFSRRTFDGNFVFNWINLRVQCLHCGVQVPGQYSCVDICHWVFVVLFVDTARIQNKSHCSLCFGSSVFFYMFEVGCFGIVKLRLSLIRSHCYEKYGFLKKEVTAVICIVQMIELS